MFDLLTAALAERAGAAPAVPTPTPWLALMLDEIDYGMLLLADCTRVLHANHAARSELDATHPLQVVGGEVRVGRPQDLPALRDALAGARERGLRRLINLGVEAQRVSVAVVPLATGSDMSRLTLLVFGKRQVCETLSVHWFARSHGLTPAEARVLAALCEGQQPSQIAKALGVALSTVRTQIGSMRAKTCAASIRALVRQVAVLPPLVGGLRGTALH